MCRIRFHDLRHTYASLMIDQRGNIKYIQTQLRHSSPMVTLNVYGHLMNQTISQQRAGWKMLFSSESVTKWSQT